MKGEWIWLSLDMSSMECSTSRSKARLINKYSVLNRAT